VLMHTVGKRLARIGDRTIHRDVAGAPPGSFTNGYPKPVGASAVALQQ
jgi:hypothetical protein